MKLLLIGFDGLDGRLFESTDLPALAGLRETSQWGTLLSRERLTGPCWTTILTGLSVGTHGVTHPLGLPYDGSEWIGSRPRDYLWDELGLAGWRVGVMNFPVCHMPRAIEREGSWMVGGWPGRPMSWPTKLTLPRDLYSDLNDYAERGPLLSQRPKGAMPDWVIHEWPWEKYIVWARENALRRLEVIRSLPEVDVLMIQESVMDRAGHMLSTPNKGALSASDPRYAQALRLVNDFVGLLMDEHESEFVALVSDHGFKNADEPTEGRGLRHSEFGTWGLRGPDVLAVRNDMEQESFMSTVLDALGIHVEREGRSILFRASDRAKITERLKGLGYAE